MIPPDALDSGTVEERLASLESSREEFERLFKTDIDKIRADFARLAQELKQGVDLAIPVGTIIMLAADRPAPPGYLLCDGAIYDIRREEHRHLTALRDVLLNTWGGDGISTFQVPDVGGQFPRFFDKSGRFDPDRKMGTSQGFATAMPGDDQAFRVTGDGTHPHATGPESRSHNHNLHVNGVTFRSLRRGLVIQSFPTDTTVGAIDETVLTTTEPPDTQRHVHAIPTSGSHGHGIVGGNRETRPRNVTLVGYIRF
jgi:microcystin-dependent protein